MSNTQIQQNVPPIQEPSIDTVSNRYFFIYLDIISPRRIGSRNVRVLKVIDVGNKNNFHFNNIEYVPIEKKLF